MLPLLGGHREHGVVIGSLHHHRVTDFRGAIRDRTTKGCALTDMDRKIVGACRLRRPHGGRDSTDVVVGHTHPVAVELIGAEGGGIVLVNLGDHLQEACLVVEVDVELGVGSDLVGRDVLEGLVLQRAAAAAVNVVAVDLDVAQTDGFEAPVGFQLGKRGGAALVERSALNELDLVDDLTAAADADGRLQPTRLVLRIGKRVVTGDGFSGANGLHVHQRINALAVNGDHIGEQHHGAR